MPFCMWMAGRHLTRDGSPKRLSKRCGHTKTRAHEDRAQTTSGCAVCLGDLFYLFLGILCMEVRREHKGGERAGIRGERRNLGRPRQVTHGQDYRTRHSVTCILSDVTGWS